MTTGSSPRSQQACPMCGEHQVAIVEHPEISVVGAQPFNEIVGMGDPDAPLPGLECRACGTAWPSIDAFRAAVHAAGGS